MTALGSLLHSMRHHNMSAYQWFHSFFLALRSSFALFVHSLDPDPFSPPFPMSLLFFKFSSLSGSEEDLSFIVTLIFRLYVIIGFVDCLRIGSLQFAALSLPLLRWYALSDGVVFLWPMFCCFPSCFFFLLEATKRGEGMNGAIMPWLKGNVSEAWGASRKETVIVDS